MEIGFIVISVSVFTGNILLLVFFLSMAEKKLVKQEACKIVVNNDEDHPFQVPAGGTLLSSLTDQKVLLPAACGGNGICSLCRCQVTENNQGILDTEKGIISHKDAREGWRLACQVKVRDDLKIQVPESVFNIRKYNCTVRSNANVATFIKELVLDLDPGQQLDFRAGSYIQIDIPEYSLNFRDFDIEDKYRSDWDKLNLWELKAENHEPIFRAYSMANHPAEGSIIMLNVRIATPPIQEDFLPGIASSYVFKLKPGDKAVISGPYGDFLARDTDREMVYIGGGAGMAPMRSHLFDLFKTKRTKRKVSFWYGARSEKENFYQEDFFGLDKDFENFRYTVALSDPLPEDKWSGPVGFIHQVLYDEYLKDHPEPEELEYYVCGPPMMVDAIINMLHGLGVEDDMIMFDMF
ncbi:NADH:ubiquinone reductase (Na(+)-transporting) subunit F [Fibrobacterota bacterium]